MLVVNWSNVMSTRSFTVLSYLCVFEMPIIEALIKYVPHCYKFFQAKICSIFFPMWYHLASLCICSPYMEILFPLTTVWILTAIVRLSQFLHSPLMDGGGFHPFTVNTVSFWTPIPGYMGSWPSAIQLSWAPRFTVHGDRVSLRCRKGVPGPRSPSTWCYST